VIATIAIHQQLTEIPAHKNPSGIYKLKCNTCNNAYIGQSGRSITVRHTEHIRYVRTNNPTSAYALHILNNKHEYWTAAETSELLKPCHKGTRMNCWETFHMQAFSQHKLLITEQHISDINPSMNSQTRHESRYKKPPPNSVSFCTAHNTHATPR
jgi:hypothetical protein